MLGSFRFFLATCVVVGHLTATAIIGGHAVHGFFVLSGYLMTFVMHKSYGYTTGGRVGFAVNRALRLYPAYLVTIVISWLLISFAGEDTASWYRKALGVPADLWTWFQNFSMVYVSPFPADVEPRLSPATWALTIEIFFYAAICLGASRSKRATLSWLAISLIYNISTFALGLGSEYRYNFILGGSLPFAIGATLYHYRDRLTIPVRPGVAFSLFVPVFLLLVMISYAGRESGIAAIEEVSFFSNIALNTVAILALLPTRSGHLDKLAGDMSYHIYILHWPVGMFISTQLFGIAKPERSITGMLALIVSVAVCCTISYLIIRLVDMRVETLRGRVRSRKPGQPAANAVTKAT